MKDKNFDEQLHWFQSTTHSKPHSYFVELYSQEPPLASKRIKEPLPASKCSQQQLSASAPDFAAPIQPPQQQSRQSDSMYYEPMATVDTYNDVTQQEMSAAPKIQNDRPSVPSYQPSSIKTFVADTEPFQRPHLNNDDGDDDDGDDDEYWNELDDADLNDWQTPRANTAISLNSGQARVRSPSPIDFGFRLQNDVPFPVQANAPAPHNAHRIQQLKEEKRKVSDELWDLQEQGADNATMQALRQRRLVFLEIKRCLY